MLTNAPKGTKDIMPDQVYKWHYVERKWKESVTDTDSKRSVPPCLNIQSCSREVSEILPT